MNFPFLKKETFGLRTQETFIGNKCEIYLPASFFNPAKPEIAIAKELGERIETMGLFWFKVDGEMYELQFPLKFQFKFSERSKKTFKLAPELPEDTFNIFILNKGDAFVYDILHLKDLDDLKKDFLDKIIEKAKLPSYIQYTDALDVFIKALLSTGSPNLGVTMLSIEVLLSELFRYKKNMRDPFRKHYNGKNLYDYKMVSLVKVPSLSGTFQSLIGEDVNNQIISSVLRHREGVEEIEAPIEKVLKY